MTGAAAGQAGLVPIDEVARQFGIRASAIRYYEERGLLEPVLRRAGRRWYGPAEIRRLAIIQYWQQSGLMSLEEIGEILAGPGASGRWQQVVTARIEALRARAERMNAARAYLEHVLAHHRDTAPDGCDHFESLIWGQSSPTPAALPAPASLATRGRGPGGMSAARDRTEP
jgi:MerR family copper efflux transcriptional regulator